MLGRTGAGEKSVESYLQERKENLCVRRVLEKWIVSRRGVYAI